MKIKDDEVVFSSGRREYANCGIIGINPKMEITEGYDDIFFTECGHNMMFDHGFPDKLGFAFCPWCGNKLDIQQPNTGIGV